MNSENLLVVVMTALVREGSVLELIRDEEAQALIDIR
jgi:hypothetical protein